MCDDVEKKFITVPLKHKFNEIKVFFPEDESVGTSLFSKQFLNFIFGIQFENYAAQLLKK